MNKIKKVWQQQIRWGTPGNDLWIQVGDTVIDRRPYCPLLKTCPPCKVPICRNRNVPICRKSNVTHKNCDRPIECYPNIPRIGLLDCAEETKSPEPNQDKTKAQCPGWGIQREVRDCREIPNPRKHWGRNIIELERCSFMTECVTGLTTTFELLFCSINHFIYQLNQLSITTVDICCYIARFVKETRKQNLNILICSIKHALYRWYQH